MVKKESGGKRRGSGSGSGGRKKSKTSAAGDDNVDDESVNSSNSNHCHNNRDVLLDLESLRELYDGGNPSSLCLQQAVDQGWIRTQVGPSITTVSTTTSTTTTLKKEENNNNNNQRLWLYHLYAMLLSHEGQSGRLTAATTRYILEQVVEPQQKQQPPPALRTTATITALEYLLRQEPSLWWSSNDQYKYKHMAILCHCLTLLGGFTDPLEAGGSVAFQAWSIAVSTKKTLKDSNLVPGMELLLYISEHQREYFLRQYSNVVFTKGLSSSLSDQVLSWSTKNEANAPPFVVAVVQTILQCLEKGVQIEMDMDNADATSTETKTRKRHEMLFLHRSLELLIDMLSSSLATPKSNNAVNSPTTLYLRTYLVFYLQAIHFDTRCLRQLKWDHHQERNREAPTSAGWKLVQQLLQRIQSWMRQPLDLQTAAPLTSTAHIMQLYYRRASAFQKLCHKYHAGTLADVIFAGLGRLCHGQECLEFLPPALASLTQDQLVSLLHKLRLLDQAETTEPLATLYRTDRDFILQGILIQGYLAQPNDMDIGNSSISRQPLFPTESLLWDATRLPPRHARLLLPSQVLNLPKLHATQFLNYHDYLNRNFTLLQLETASDICGDLVTAISKLRPLLTTSGNDEDGDAMMMNDNAKLSTTFAGWARMALELQSTLKIVKVEPPLLGQTHPHKVLAECTIDLQPCGAALRKEWDELGDFDNIFFVSIDASKATGDTAPTVAEYRRLLGYDDNDNDNDDGDNRNDSKDKKKARDRRGGFVPDEDDFRFPQRFGVRYVRGGTIVNIRDEKGTVLTDPAVGTPATGAKRTICVTLDPVQYGRDASRGILEECYGTLNLVVRRHGRENSFKSLLDTTQQLLTGTDSVSQVLPTWLQPVLLGHGPPDAANYQSLSMQAFAKQTAGVTKPDAYLDYGDTFLNEEHLRESFAGLKASEIKIDGRGPDENMDPGKEDGWGTLQTRRKYHKIRCTEHKNDSGEIVKTVVEATSYHRPDDSSSAGNPIRFTSTQVEAIRSGLSCGLTLIVGPPGTGKTDVAVQIIASLYHSFPTQRTVIITHSNAALNDLFEKVMARGDVPERYLLRLGAGERDLQTDSTHDFTKLGRVAYCWNRRAQLLEQVQQISESLGLSGRAERGQDGSPSYTCESAAVLYETKIQSLATKFDLATKNEELSPSDIANRFPLRFYCKVGDVLALADAKKHFASLSLLFEELSEYRPLEILKSQRQRSDYFLMKQARIVAMTSTHAAVARSRLIELGFEYDNLVLEEAGQMTELDTFVPLLLQKKSGDTSKTGVGGSRLKRVCLLGDHNQLPPVIKNMSFARYSNMDQSMFGRLVRSGAPVVQLDKQGRARPQLADLYNWRYQDLGNLEHVSSGRFLIANAGFLHSFQFIDVQDFQGKGETTPTAFYYQNVGEAEYAVALFQFMVLLGYPPMSISILTTYNGQKELIGDILAQRCGYDTPLAGIRPGTVSTVDQYQGQQNDYILLSLVRTASIGHVRDVRRLIVAVSRARFGLYVLGCQDLFALHEELRPIFSKLFRNGDDESGSCRLQLVLNETFPTERKENEPPSKSEDVFEIEDVEHMGELVHQMQQDLLAQQEQSDEPPESDT